MASSTTFPQRYEGEILRQDFQRWEACDRPPAWAQYRDAAAKSLPWFHIVQGGVDMTNLKAEASNYSPTPYVTGILIDGYPAVNSYLDSEVIITSLHGASKTPTAVATRRVSALQSTRNDQRLVGCLVGRGATKLDSAGTSFRGNKRKWGHNTSAFFSCPMPKNQDCWVLGFYIITDIWDAETSQGLVTMFRLERWKLEDKAWWANKADSHNPPPLAMRDFTTKAPEETCQTCGKTSPRMFDDFFLCRDKTCTSFWKHDGIVATQDLTYSKSYLQQREPRRSNGFRPYGAYLGGSSFPEIASPFQSWWEDHYRALQTSPITKQNFRTRMTALNSGFWCPYCGMLNRRLKWNRWECASKDCTFFREGHPSTITAAQIIQFGKTKPTNWSKLPCYDREEDSDGYMRYHYDLTHGCGVTVLVPKEGTNARPQGSDWLWDRFQILANSGALGLEKQFIPTASGGTVSNHFIANFGRQYKLQVAISQTKSFENAPRELSIVKDTANALCRQYQNTQATNGEDFNECYVAGYFTDNMMHWHNDGESGLGSVIATWTLGGEGTMSFAPNCNQYWGQTRSGKIIEDDHLLPGVRHEAERRALKETLDVTLQAHADPSNSVHVRERKAALKVYKDAFSALCKKDQRPPNAGPHKWLTFPLTHGSVVVMHGQNMQKHFVHEVSVGTPLRFALTLRHIAEGHLRDAKASRRSGQEYPHIPDTSYLVDFRKEVLEGEAKRKKV